MRQETTFSTRTLNATTGVKAVIAAAGTPFAPNDTAITGHAIGASAVLVTNNMREFAQVPSLPLKDWVK